MSDDLTTFQKRPRDKEHPFVMINRDLVRNETLHPSARWMLIYLLSMKDGWNVNVNQLIKHCKEHFGCKRDSVYKWITQAIEAGYMKKEAYNEKGLIRYRYEFDEYPIFKKSLPDPILPDPVQPDPARSEHKKEHIQDPLSPPKGEDKENISNITSEVPKGPPTPPQATELAKYLLKKRKELYPRMKDPKIYQWAKHIRLMYERDNRPWEEIRNVIDFVFDDDFWCENILSAEKLRLQYDKLIAKMTPVNNKGTREAECKRIALEIKQHLIQSGTRNQLSIFKTKCLIGEKGEEVVYNMNPIEFESILTKAYGLRKKDE